MSSGNGPKRHFIIIFFVAFYVIIILRNAWVCDDAYISFRVIDNFINGYGLRWNVVERVQAYTNPLWLLLMIPSSRLAGQVYFATLALSLLFSIAAIIWFAYKNAASWATACLGIFILTMSRAFIDYSTSGLENPLTFFLISVGMYLFLRKEISWKNFFLLCLITSIAMVNRLDSILIFLPLLVYSFWRIRSSRAICLFALGFIPLILWELFSLFYYGFPFPNTAYAKLGSGMETSQLCEQGFCYFINAVTVDPLMMMVIGFALVIPVVMRQKKAAVAASGIFLMLAYIVRIGGCFMSGRYFAAPFLAAVMIIISLIENFDPKKLLLVGGVVALVGLSQEFSPMYTKFYEGRQDDKTFFHNGITDEHKYYFEQTGLINFRKELDTWPTGPRVFLGLDIKSGDEKVIIGSSGMMAYFAGPDVYIIDDVGLSDPLLARLPLYAEDDARIGHFKRRLPRGYKETIRSGVNQIVDPYLAEYYDRLSFIIRGPLFSPKRLMEIVKINLGVYDHLIEDFVYPEIIEVKLSDISTPKENGTIWNDSTNYIIGYVPLEIVLGKTSHAARIEISHDHNDRYRIVFYGATNDLAEYLVETAPIRMDGLYVREFDVPGAAVQAGYDRIRIIPETGDGMYSVGHIRLLENEEHRHRQ